MEDKQCEKYAISLKIIVLGLGMAKTNRLSIYMVKPEVLPEQIIKDEHKDRCVEIGDDQFYYESSPPKAPSWLSNFFVKKLDTIAALEVANSKGVLVTSVRIEDEVKRFVICFGNGRFMLNNDVCEERFGLKVTLNSVDPNSIRAIEKVSIGANSKNSKEQLSKASKAMDFGIDVEQDLLKTVTGKSNIKELGKTVTGVDSLSVSAKVDVNNLTDFLKRCNVQFLSTEYQKHFDWVDQIQELRSKDVIKKLDLRLLQTLNERNLENVWMAVPEIIDWNDVAGFKYPSRYKKLSDDLSISDFLSCVESEIGDVNILKKKFIKAQSATTDSDMHSWSAYKCIYAEFNTGVNCYVLNGGKWYEVNNAFVSAVNRSYESIPISDIVLPDYEHGSEGEYNKAVAGSDDSFLWMDTRAVMHGGGSNRIEFCDLFTRKNQLIHVKQYGASAVLSHLFQQGLNSAEYFNSDSEFRRKLNEKLPVGWKLPNPNNRINAADYEVVYAIISNNLDERPRIPFFSKVSIKNARRKLETMQFKVSLKRIKSIK